MLTRISLNGRFSCGARAFAVLAPTLLLTACGGGGGGGSDSTPQLSVEDTRIAEPNGSKRSTVRIPLTLDKAAKVDISGRYRFADASALRGVDYDGLAGRFTIAAGEQRTTISVEVIGDDLYEQNERFNVEIVRANDVDIADPKAVVTIVDNETAPVLSIEDVAITEEDDGERELEFTLQLDSISGRDVAGTFLTTGVTALDGSDYIGESGGFTIPAGQQSAAVKVTVLSDVEFEGDETFALALASVEDAVIATPTATATIIENDPTGLTARPVNSSCIAPDRPAGNASISLVDAYPTAPDFQFITKILQAPGDGSRWYASEKWGGIRVFDTADPTNARIWYSLAGRVNAEGEAGFLSMAFHPDYPAVPELYVSYTTGSGADDVTSIISRLILDDPDAPGAGTVEQVLLTLDQPYTTHNAGDITFGPDDRMLYISLGDGGDAADPGNRSQNTANMFGTILRIDVLDVPFSDPAGPYRIPTDNPFYDSLNPGLRCGPGDDNGFACPEIFAWGLRNPWRFSIDAPTGAIWAGDVGQSLWEEVNKIELGGNYGWDCREGARVFANNNNPLACTSPVGLVDPASEYPHEDGDSSITGGFVYRGTDIPELQGRYVFGDYASGRVWALAPDNKGGFRNDEVFDADFFVSNFAIGADGELYLSSYFPSRIYRLAPLGTSTGSTIPDDLADTGCADTSVLIPYDINASFWSDNAVKRRFIGLPDGESIRVDEEDDWLFPIGTVLVKSFELEDKLIETRLFMRHTNGSWAGYTYEWNDAETAATRVRGGKTREVGSSTWIYPSEGECMQCHTAAAGRALGPESAQLNRKFGYESTGVEANQVVTLTSIGVFDPVHPGPEESLPKLAEPFGDGSLDDRARAYLHTNCAQCHQPGGPVPPSVAMDFRYSVALPDMKVCNVVPAQGDLGIVGARLIAPGAPAKSVILNRISRRDSKGMPPTGSAIQDSNGIALLEAWVNDLSAADCRR